ncbi:uncharacterized protein LOC114298754 isoform X2 [Camellia sinensis]|uniref:uncharacterized protein LOC114298754 isoform X2 n=1 Tax=Camellia sinensis TaxID=4442 RepID=UPI0010365384|nr:uncharacterized protein LOC114298754 isoform X2 [Camellia sinensis]
MNFFPARLSVSPLSSLLPSFIHPLSYALLSLYLSSLPLTEEMRWSAATAPLFELCKRGETPLSPTLSGNPQVSCNPQFQVNVSWKADPLPERSQFLGVLQCHNKFNFFWLTDRNRRNTMWRSSFVEAPMKFLASQGTPQIRKSKALIEKWLSTNQLTRKFLVETKKSVQQASKIGYVMGFRHSCGSDSNGCAG